jgi:hypothetical protein
MDVRRPLCGCKSGSNVSSVTTPDQDDKRLAAVTHVGCGGKALSSIVGLHRLYPSLSGISWDIDR